MGRVEKAERAVQDLSPEELAKFHDWFAESVWDQQLERDVKAGKLDRLADEALGEHASGNTRPL